MSLVYTGLGVGFIWLAFFGIGQFVTWAVFRLGSSGSLLEIVLIFHQVRGKQEGTNVVNECIHLTVFCTCGIGLGLIILKFFS